MAATRLRTLWLLAALGAAAGLRLSPRMGLKPWKSGLPDPSKPPPSIPAPPKEAAEGPAEPAPEAKKAPPTASSKAKAAQSQETGNELGELVELEGQLAALLEKTADGGVGKQPQRISGPIVELVEKIERLSATPEPLLQNAELAYALMGDWRLRFVNNEGFLKYKGISGTAALPLCKLQLLMQRISNERPTAQLVEIVKILGNQQVVVLKGESSLMEKVIVDQEYTSIDVSGVSMEQQESKSWRLQLKCTFVGDLVFIGRSASDALFIYKRLEPGQLEATIKEALN